MNWWLNAHGRRELTLLLFLEWDPIGINHERKIWREYEGYVDRLASMAVASDDAALLAGEMSRIAAEEMGMPTGLDTDVAELFRHWTITSLSAWRDEDTG